MKAIKAQETGTLQSEDTKNRINSLESQIRAADELAKAANTFIEINSGLSGMESYQALWKALAAYDKAKGGK